MDLGENLEITMLQVLSRKKIIDSKNFGVSESNRINADSEVRDVNGHEVTIWMVVVVVVCVLVFLPTLVNHMAH